MSYTHWFVFASALTAACSGHKDASSASGETSDESASCASDSRVSPYTANMQVAGSTGQLVFTLVNATPAPPAQGTNTWTVAVGPKGGPQSSSYKLNVVPYMPDHGHGPSVNPTIKTAGDAYQVGDLDFFMGGVWRVTVTASDANNTNIDSGNFFFCVPG